MSDVKCVVWDLDNTLWFGTLLEDAEVRPNNRAMEVIRELDRRGILNTIASRSDGERAAASLERFGIAEYFVAKEVSWSPKSTSVEKIAESIGLNMDSIVFIDDEAFEREEVRYAHPTVRCYSPTVLDGILELSEFDPIITSESSRRRERYLAENTRKQMESEFDGTPRAFLEQLDLELAIWPASVVDLDRASELTVRTHQLNTTGTTYSRDELCELIESDNHVVLLASLKDCYGDYGTIGLALVEKALDDWTLKLFLLSCRVISRSIGGAFLREIAQLSNKAGATLSVRCVPNDRNRMMLITLRLAGFQMDSKSGSSLRMRLRRGELPPPVSHVEVQYDDPS